MEKEKNIQNLIKIKENILKSIENIDNKRKSIQNSISIISPNISKESKIKELEIDKIKVNLQKNYKEVDLQIKYSLGYITEEEYNLNAQFIQDQSNKELNQINENLIQINNQKTDEFSELNRVNKNNTKITQTQFTNAKKDLARAYSVQLKSIAKFGGKEAIIGVISVLVNKGLSKLSKEVGNLEIMVENVNEVIANIKTKDDIEKAKRLRNNAIRLLNSAEKRLRTIERIIKTITRTLRILNIALRILRLAALLPGAPKALLVVLIAAIGIINALLIILTSTQNSINKLIYKIDELRRRLREINDILDIKLLDTNLDNLDLFNLTIVNFGRLGLLGIEYKGFRFVIKEENDPKFVIQGYKRRYAVAIDRNGNDILIGEPSFTLDPDVLVEQLRLIIDEQNLEP